MISLSKLAGVCRQYGVPFRIDFTDRISYATIGGALHEHRDTAFFVALREAGARPVNAGHDIRVTLESLT